MKALTPFVLGALALLTAPSFAATKEIELHTEKVGEVVHWMPETVEVTPGDTVKFTVKHELEGGFDFHGFFIPELKITEKIDRNKTKTITKKIPKSLKPGTYKVGCQFHEKHAPASLVVKEAAKTAAKPGAKAEEGKSGS